MQRLLEKLFSNERPSDSEVLTLYFLSIFIDISTQGGIDFPCCQKKTWSVHKSNPAICSALKWWSVASFSEMVKRLYPSARMCWFPCITNSPYFQWLEFAKSYFSVLSPLPGSAWAEHRVGITAGRSPAPCCVLFLLQRDCSLKAGNLGLKWV